MHHNFILQRTSHDSPQIPGLEVPVGLLLCAKIDQIPLPSLDLYSLRSDIGGPTPPFPIKIQNKTSKKPAIVQYA